MTAPVLVLPVIREIEKSVTLAEKSTQLGDGYKQTMSLGTRPKIITWSITSIPLTFTQYQTVETNLRTWQGVTAFQWSPDNEVTQPREVFFCDQWEWNIQGPNAYQLSAEFTLDNTFRIYSLVISEEYTSMGSIVYATQTINYNNVNPPIGWNTATLIFTNDTGVLTTLTAANSGVWVQKNNSGQQTYPALV
jgi:phage-related protein